MSNITFKLNNDEAIIGLCGRVDSTNAADLENGIKNYLNSNPHTSLTADLEKLEYISSAGLRVILRLCKDEKKFCLINASSEVYEILEMTGFTEMIPVKKAYRRISVDGCEIIGRGAMGTVYRLDEDIIVKVYNESVSPDDINRERELARKAFVLGIPTAIPFDVVKVGNAYGSVFELLKAKSFAELIIAAPAELDKYIDLSVELMKTIHSTAVRENDLPAFKNKAVGTAQKLKAFLPADKAEKFRKMAEAIPDTNTMVHGDLHIKNIMMQNGEILLIDMDTLGRGHPVFEFEAIFQAYIAYSEIDKNNTCDFFGIRYETAEKIWKETLRRYFRDKDEAYIAEISDKISLLGYASLFCWFIGENANPEGYEKALTDAYMKRILELIDKVDGFEFE
ncbi:MAG: phosphotransferase [Clostridia bacterium]|nr:phosphotransferase [Clostridia bacterium]